MAKGVKASLKQRVAGRRNLRRAQLHRLVRKLPRLPRIR